MQEVFNLIPKEYFVENLKNNTLGVIKIALLREVVNPMIIRSNYADETITYKIAEDRDLVEIPARKLKSKEKLTGLKIARNMNVVEESLRYNVIQKSEHLANPNSILFGDSVTESQDAVGLTSRVIYDWAYSIRDIEEITDTFQHNALSEGGTMRDEETGKLRQSLFQVQYVMPGTYFPHFLTLENVTPELLLHLLYSVMNTRRYGAQSTTLDNNIINHLVGIGTAQFEAPLNSFMIAKNWNADKDVTYDSVQDAITQEMKAYYKDSFLEGSKIKEVMESIRADHTKLESVYKTAKGTCTKFLEEIKIIK